LLIGQSIGIDNNSQTISLVGNGAKDIALNKAAIFWHRRDPYVNKKSIV
jgi:hypothetical protein